MNDSKLKRTKGRLAFDPVGTTEHAITVPRTVPRSFPAIALLRGIAFGMCTFSIDKEKHETTCMTNTTKTNTT